jgi:hypothetical protein
MNLIDFIYAFSANDLLFNYHFPALQHERNGAYKAREVNANDETALDSSERQCLQARCERTAETETRS